VSRTVGHETVGQESTKSRFAGGFRATDEEYWGRFTAGAGEQFGDFFVPRWMRSQFAKGGALRGICTGVYLDKALESVL